MNLQAWNERRNLVRRMTGVEEATRNKLILRIERFGKRQGTLTLLDARHPGRRDMAGRASRTEFRELFRRFLLRQFPSYKVAELTTEPDLEHSLSPSYPRALLRQGTSAWAAIGASADPFHAQGILTFGLVWLDYLRRRESTLTVHGLILYLPAGQEKTTCLRLLFLNPAVAQFAAFVYNGEGVEDRIDLRDYGNLDTHLEPCRHRSNLAGDELTQLLLETPGVEGHVRGDGELSLRVRGMEFARTFGNELLFGLDRRQVSHRSNGSEILCLAGELERLRSPDAADRQNPLYLRNPEAWLESQVRRQIEAVDAQLRPAPIYGQIPAFAATDRGVLDLLAVGAERPAGGAGIEGLRRHSSTFAGPGLLDAREVARRAARVHGECIFSRHRAATRSAALAIGFARARFSSRE